MTTPCVTELSCPHRPLKVAIKAPPPLDGFCGGGGLPSSADCSVEPLRSEPNKQGSAAA